MVVKLTILTMFKTDFDKNLRELIVTKITEKRFIQSLLVWDIALLHVELRMGENHFL